MASEPGRPGRQAYDRWFLLGEKRNELLALWEVQQYGRDSFGDPDYVSIYGLKPHEWYARGVRILGRTAVECTRDRLAGLIGRDIAAVTRAARAATPMVVDLFAGSGNTLCWIKRHVGARRATGFELDDAVFELARKNIVTMGLGLDLRHDSYQHGLQILGQHPVHGAGGQRRRGFLEPGQRRPVRPGELRRQRGLEDGQRLAELHRAALELPQDPEDLLGRPLLYLGRDQFGGAAAEALSEAQRGASGQPNGEGRQFGGARQSPAREIAHIIHCRSACKMSATTRHG